MTPSGLMKFSDSAKILKEKHDFIADTKRKPFYGLRKGRRWIEDNLKQLSKNSITVYDKMPRRGWKPLILSLTNSLEIVVYIPPSFPEEVVKIYRRFVIGVTNNFMELDLPEGAWAGAGSSLSKLKLLDLAQYYKEICK
jgi:hypothetical protein